MTTTRKDPKAGPSILSDNDLISRIRRLRDRERKTVLAILEYLIEIERRDLYLRLGYSSMFDFCVRRLGYSESTAGRRIRIARCIRDYPSVHGLLASGRCDFTVIARISGVITMENASGLLAEIEGKSVREVDMIVARLRPRGPVIDRVRPLCIMKETIPGDPEAIKGGRSGENFTPNVGSEKFPTDGSSESGPSDDPERSGPDSGEPEKRVVLEQVFKIEFGAGGDFMKKLEKVRALVSGAHGNNLEFEKLFGILIDEYIERHSPEARAARRGKRSRATRGKGAGSVLKGSGKRTGSASFPLHEGQRDRVRELSTHDDLAVRVSACPVRRERTDKGSGRAGKGSRHIPASVRDGVYVRDRGRCTFVSAGGVRCGSTRDIQIDHIVPFALGGRSSPENLRLLCGKHNRLEAERVYGKDLIDRRRRISEVIREAERTAG